jgi:hypothetical protein
MKVMKAAWGLNDEIPGDLGPLRARSESPRGLEGRVLKAAIFLLLCGADPGRAAPGALDFMWWRAMGSARTADGGMTVEYELYMPPGMENQSDAEIFVLSSVRLGTSSTRAYAAPEIFRETAKVRSGSPLKVILYSGRTERMELRVTVRSGDWVYRAGTVVNCYGESGKNGLGMERTDAAPDWPGLQLAMGDGFYRAQAGSPVMVKCGAAPEFVEIFENGKLAARAAPDENALFSYVPPHEDALSKAGYSAKKDLVFVAADPDGRGKTTFYLPVYRAYYGRSNIRGGLAALSASAAASLAFLWARGRKFRWR